MFGFRGERGGVLGVVLGAAVPRPIAPPQPRCSLMNPPLVQPLEQRLHQRLVQPLKQPPPPWWRNPPPVEPQPLEPHESANTGPAPRAKARMLDEARV